MTFRPGIQTCDASGCDVEITFETRWTTSRLAGHFCEPCAMNCGIKRQNHPLSGAQERAKDLG